MEFAIDRLRAKQNPKPVKIEKPKCEHPSWFECSDGHTRRWYECSKCGDTIIPPWMFRSEQA